MAYRGDDLDLRTPQGWSSSAREQASEPNWWTRSTVYAGGGSDPIWVDDNVMASCNHAFDLAVAHRSAEVRLEHLINALTLNEPAAQILEGRGLSVTSLRRESGVAIANDVPAVSGSGQIAPKRSEALVEVLRKAADHAYPRRTPVTVDDLLQVLFGMKRDIPGVQLLFRNSAGWSPRNGADIRLEQQPRPTYQSAPRPRYASTQAHDYFSQTVSREPAHRLPPLREPLPVRDVPPQTVADSYQDARLDNLERAMREIANDLSDDRKTIRNLVGELQRTAAAQADDTGRFRGSLSDRFAALEDAVLRMRSEPSQIPSNLFDRIGSIERSLEGRLNDFSRATNALFERVAAMETLQQRPVEANLSPLLTQRLDAISSFADRLDSVERTFQLILDRMTGIERKLAEAPRATSVNLAPLETRLASIERTFSTAAMDLSPVTDLLSGIESRVAGLERSVEARTAETGQTVSFIGERLRAFEDAINGQRASSTEQIGQIERALTAFAETSVTSAGNQSDLVELHDALLKLNANQQTLATSLEQWRLDNTGDLSVINNRLKVIEETEHIQNPLVGELAEQVAAIHRTIARREARRSRFRHWLFGTDEWYSASYDTERWRNRQLDSVIPSNPIAETVTIQQRPTPPAPPPSMARRS